MDVPRYRTVPTRRRALAAALLLASGAGGGCVSAEAGPTAAGGLAPVDFAVEIKVVGDPTPAATDPAWTTADYVVQADRRLRVAMGPRAEGLSSPPISRTITADERERLYRWVWDRQLMAEPTSPRATTRPAVTTPRGAASYAVAITAHGKTHAFRTTPEESPPTAELVRAVAALRGPIIEPPASEPRTLRRRRSGALVDPGR